MLLVVGDGRTTTFHHPRFGHQAVTNAVEEETVTENTVIKKTVTPEDLRKQAEELIRAAEEAEKKAGDRAEIKNNSIPLNWKSCNPMGWPAANSMNLLMLWLIWEKPQKLKQLSL
jgi:hypothetical protein